MGVVVVDILPP